MSDTGLTPIERIERGILVVRGQRVMIDADLADLYRVPTKALNQAVRRNADRFPPDFMFQLTAEEKSELVTKCDHLRRLRFSPSPPNAFTEHGAVMLASVLNSKVAVETSILVVRAFMRLRQLLASHAELSRKVEALEKKYDARFRAVFEAIKQLMATDAGSKQKRIGF